MPAPATGRAGSVSRRDFLKLCSSVALILGVGPSRVAAALAAGPRPSVLWLSFAGCTGCSESVLRMVSPFFDDLAAASISLDYHETLMASSGATAESLLTTLATQNSGNFFCVVEGSIPTVQNGAWGMIGGRTMLSIAEEICPKAQAVICLGTCSSYGGLAAASPNPSQAKSVADALPALAVPVINCPGCPPNPTTFAALFASYLLTGSMPALDTLARPTFAYGRVVHDQCPYVDTQRCTETKGCKGRRTSNNCPQVKFNEGTSFPMQVGHPCIGCSEPGFWDSMSPFYSQYHVMSVKDQRRRMAGAGRPASPPYEFDLQGRQTGGSARQGSQLQAAGVRIRRRARTVARTLGL